MEFTFHLSKKEAREAFAEHVTTEEWLQLFEEHSRSYGDYEVDLKIAEFFVERLKEEYIDKYMYDEIPDVLKPLVM